jgi:hypothetical protein
MRRMSTPDTTPDMTFTDLDSAESALDWIGLDFVEGEGEEDGAGGWFTGELDDDAVERLDAALQDAETPLVVRALAQTLRQRWADGAGPRAWRVTFPA